MKNLVDGRNRSFKGYFSLKEKIGDFDKLKIEVFYSIGGMNYFSGSIQARGYKILLKPVSVCNGIESSMMLSGNQKLQGGSITIETTNRFNSKRLKELAELVDPIVEDLVTAYESDDRNKLLELSKVTV